MGEGARGSSTAPGRSGNGPRVPFTGYPGFVAHPYREYSEVFFGDTLPGAARRFVRHAPACRLQAVPQLGPTRTPAALCRSQDRAMKTALGDIEIVSRLGRGRADAGLRRARRADTAVQGDPAEALLRHRGLTPVRGDLPPARVLPDPHRAGDPRGHVGGDRRGHRRGRAGRARQRRAVEDAAAAGRDAARRGRWTATCPSTSPRSC